MKALILILVLAIGSSAQTWKYYTSTKTDKIYWNGKLADEDVGRVMWLKFVPKSRKSKLDHSLQRWVFHCGQRQSSIVQVADYWKNGQTKQQVFKPQRLPLVPDSMAAELYSVTCPRG